MNKIVLVFVINCFSLVSASAFVSGNTLQDFFERDTTLEKGVYVIDNNVKIGKNATLTIKAGCRLYFKKGASIRVDGGILFAGISKSNIEVTSENREDEGYGIIISGSDADAEIIINYTNFSNLLVPLNFEKNWARNSVSIENNTFQNIVTGEPCIIINKPDEISTHEEIPFIFSANNFIFNNSSVSIENVDSDVLNLQFYNNLITSNYYFGFELGGGLYSPFTAGFNNKDAKYQTIFLGNSIYNNYMLNDANDSIIKEVNFGIKGRGEKYLLDNNYFGNKPSAEIQKTFDHSINNPGAPFISVAKPLQLPSNMTHGHVYKVLFNGIVPINNARPEIKEEVLKVTVNYNRPLMIREGVNYVNYSYFDSTENKLITKGLTSSLQIDKENFVIIFTIKDDIYLKEKQGYFTIIGFLDNEGFMVPRVQFGKELFHNKFEKEQ